MPGFARMPSESVVPDLVLYHSHEREKAQHQARRSAAEAARLREAAVDLLVVIETTWDHEYLPEHILAARDRLDDECRAALYAEDGDDA